MLIVVTPHQMHDGGTNDNAQVKISGPRLTLHHPAHLKRRLGP